MLIHWKVMQLKVTLRINSQPDKNRIVTEKKQVSALFDSLPGGNFVHFVIISTNVEINMTSRLCNV